MNNHPTPQVLADQANARREADQAAALAKRRTNLRKNGVTTPLTRAELALQAESR